MCSPQTQVFGSEIVVPKPPPLTLTYFKVNPPIETEIPFIFNAFFALAGMVCDGAGRGGVGLTGF